MRILRIPGVRPLATRVLARLATGIDPSIPRSDPYAEIEGELARIQSDERPVIAGPWTSEVGFEVLYWIPFLRWLRDRRALEPQRVIALSRGGTASWYRGVAGRYLEVFELVRPEEFRNLTTRRTTETGGLKQMALGPLDSHILEGARTRLGSPDAHVLHPSLMYGLFRAFWNGRMPISEASRRLSFERFEPHSHLAIERLLPEREFVAVKFYFRPSFPDSPDNRAFAQRVVTELQRHTNVVLLNTGMTVDDHLDFDPEGGGSIVHLEGSMAASDNLTAQSAVLARARAFVGTYGGLAYLATAFGKPALCVASSREEIVAPHVEMGRVAARELGTSVLLLGPAELDLARTIGGVARELREAAQPSA